MTTVSRSMEANPGATPELIAEMQEVGNAAELFIELAMDDVAVFLENRGWTRTKSGFSHPDHKGMFLNVKIDSSVVIYKERTREELDALDDAAAFWDGPTLAME